MQENTYHSMEDDSVNHSKQIYKTLVDNLKDIIFHTDDKGNLIFLNNSWETITGFTKKEALGKHFLNYIYIDDVRDATSIFESLIQGNDIFYPHEIRCVTKSGEHRWLEIFARLRLDENNQIAGVFGSLTDITEQKYIQGLENELLQVSIKLTGTPSAQIPAAINFALNRIGNFFQADRSYIFEFSPSFETMTNTYEWCKENIEPQIGILQNIPCELLPKWLKLLKSNHEIVISSIHGIKDVFETEYVTLKELGIQSMLIIPIFIDNILSGFVGLDYVINTKDFTNSEVNILKVWSNMFSGIMMNLRKDILLNQAQRNFETFFKTNNDFLFVFDEQTNIIEINDTIKQRLHYDTVELLHKPVDIIHPIERREEAKKIIADIFACKTDFCSIPLITKEGELIPVETKVKSGFWNDQPAYFAVCKDVSEIKLSEEKFSRAFQSNNVLMGILNMQTDKFIDVNNTMLIQTGYTREEVIGKTVPELRLFKNLQKFFVDYEHIKNNLPFKEIEAELIKKDGTILTGLFSADSIYIGKDLCLLINMIDITKRKKAEEELKRSRIEAEEANKAKSEFLSRMSHELRTPMNSILGFAQLFEMADLTPFQRKGIKHILKSGKHLLKLINEVLDIARIESGKLSLSLEDINVKTAVKEAVDIVNPLTIEKEINIFISEGIDVNMYVRADKQRLIQVLVNLLNNAIKYNKHAGAVFVESILLEQNDVEAKVRIIIKDTGIGIADKDIPKLFVPFERINNEFTATEGTGLGLSIAQELMLIMGGTIGVESELSKGSTFWVELPFVVSEIEKLNKFSHHDANNFNILDREGSILYIEDNISNIELVKHILISQRPNIQLICEVYGSNAVKIATEKKPDMILLDLNLPDIHGSEVIKLLKSDLQTKDIPVVVLTADATPQQMTRLIRAGARSYLTKPLDLIAFLDEVDNY